MQKSIIRDAVSADGNKQKDTPPDTMQRLRDLGTLSPIRDVFTKSLPIWIPGTSWTWR